MTSPIRRRLGVGAELQPAGGVHFRVWAPRRKRIAVVVAGAAHELAPEGNGYFSGAVADARAGSLYRFRLDGEGEFPDPASRSQPEGPHGPSCVVDPSLFSWSDADWRGARAAEQVLYEMHVGTFTREGTWRAAARELPELARLGIGTIEMMPIADFAGRFGWGYDGVDVYAPTRLYGTPDDLRAFVDAAHAAGLAVILDVVYNHLGPDGNYLSQFADDYFTDRYQNDWGRAINFDGENAAPVRDFFASNAGYWVDEFHMDGVRLDATQQIYDRSPVSIMAEVVSRVRAAARGRSTVVIAENEPQEARLVRARESGGCGIDALWNDDFHHCAMVAVTGRREAYYTDYTGSAQELLSTVKHGFLFQGQRYRWQEQRRGTPALDLAPANLVNFLQNHDQVANTRHGSRIHALTSPGRLRAATALLLLAPGIPMLFQGQEFAASSPFAYFADHKPELAKAVREGRGTFMRQFASIAQAAARGELDDPGDPRTFEKCKLDFSERTRNAGILELHRDLLRMRREDASFRTRRAGSPDGAVLGAEAFALRFFGESDAGDRLLLVNLGREIVRGSIAEPLLAPPNASRWAILWSSEDPRYGGAGAAEPESEDGWRIAGHCALVLQPVPR